MANNGDAVPTGADRLLDLISEDSAEEVKLLIETGIDCTKPVYKESLCRSFQPISYACCQGSVEVVRLLLQIGVELNVPGRDGKLPIHFTCDADERNDEKKGECVQALSLLIQHNADTNAVDNMGRSPLFLACEADDVEAVRVLVVAGCDVNLQTVCGDSPMKVSCRNSKYWSYWHGKHVSAFEFPPIQITKLLLQANADLSEATLLPTAVQLGDAKLVKELLDLGMDVNMLDDNMCTPLGSACSNTNVGSSLVQLLLAHGAEVNTGGGWKKQKPLIFAYVHNSIDKIKLLLSYGAKINPEEMTELVSLTLSKSILENPEVIGPNSKELLSCRLLMAHGFSPIVQGTELNIKIHQLSMCSSYDKISPWIQTFIYPLHSLKELCRISIRRHVRVNVDDNIGLLPLPGSIKSFLKMTEFDCCDKI